MTTITDKTTIAGIDIGSNAVRFMVNNVEKIDGKTEFKKVAFLRVPVRLGEDVFTKGEIGQDKEELLTVTMQGFSNMIKAYGVQKFMACATSAMRDARNGREVVNNILARTGINIKIINGDTEADMVYSAGGLDKVMDQDRNYLYVDVGGGSTEIVVYSNHQKIASTSFQLGTVRYLVNAVDKKSLKDMKRWLENIEREYPSLSIIGSGGNINKLFKLLGKREGESIKYKELDEVYDDIKSLSVEERIDKYKLNDYRADVIEPALKIFHTISKTCKVEEIFVPKLGLVDGIVHSIYSK